MGSDKKVFMYVLIHASFVGMSKVVVQGTRQNLTQEKRGSFQPTVHKDVWFTQHTTHLDMVMTIWSID